MPIHAKKKGNSYELRIAKLFKELGWTDCVTSRSESKRTDDEGVDLCYTTPFQIQAKATERSPAYHTLLATMPNRRGKINLIFHKRNRQGTVVVMTEDSFIQLLKKLLDNNLIKPCGKP